MGSANGRSSFRFASMRASTESTTHSQLCLSKAKTFHKHIVFISAHVEVRSRHASPMQTSKGLTAAPKEDTPSEHS